MSSLRTARKFILGCSIIALVAPISIDWTVAQRSGIKGGFQQNSYPSQQAGSSPNSVYGGYESQQSRAVQQPTALAGSVNNRRTSYVRQQTISSAPRAPAPVINQQQSSSSYNEQISEADAEPASYGAVSGKPGTDFPALTQVPKTSFSCDGLPYDYGMYADEETGCQAYHVCYNGRKDSFLCGVGTVFNQRILHCDYWYSVDCGKSSQYYGSNAYMGSSQPEPGPAQASGSSNYQKNEVQPAVNRPGSVYGGYGGQAPAPSSQSNSYSRQNFRQQQQTPETQQNINYKA